MPSTAATTTGRYSGAAPRHDGVHRYLSCGDGQETRLDHADGVVRGQARGVEGGLDKVGARRDDGQAVGQAVIEEALDSGPGVVGLNASGGHGGVARYPAAEAGASVLACSDRLARSDSYSSARA